MSDETVKETAPRFEVTYLEQEEGGAGMHAAIQRHGGEVLEERPLEKVRLAYPVKKQSYVFMGSILFSIEPAALREFQADLRLNHNALRALVHKASPVPPPRGTGAETARAAAPAPAPGRVVRTVHPASEPEVLTNEALEKKIEEILQ